MRIRKDAKIWSWQLFYSSSKNIRWYFQFILRIYPVTMLSDKLCTNSNYTHSDSFSYLDISHLIKNLPSVWYCCLNWIGATTKLLYLFSSLFGKLLQRIARSLACFACTRILLLFLKVFSPFFPILQLLWLDTLIKWIEARKKQELHHTRLFQI